METGSQMLALNVTNVTRCPVWARAFSALQGPLVLREQLAFQTP